MVATVSHAGATRSSPAAPDHGLRPARLARIASRACCSGRKPPTVCSAGCEQGSRGEDQEAPRRVVDEVLRLVADGAGNDGQPESGAGHHRRQQDPTALQYWQHHCRAAHDHRDHHAHLPKAPQEARTWRMAAHRSGDMPAPGVPQSEDEALGAALTSMPLGSACTDTTVRPGPPGHWRAGPPRRDGSPARRPGRTVPSPGLP